MLNRKVKTAFTVFALLCCFVASAQDAKRDSLRRQLAADSARIFRPSKFRVFFALDNRNSFIRHTPVDFNGFQLGVIYRERHSFGFGLYGMILGTRQPVKVKDDNRVVNQQLRLNFAMLFYEFVLVSKRYYSIHLPLEAGIGSYRVTMEDSATHKIVRTVAGPVIPVGTGLQVILKPFRWIGLSGLGGFRYVREQDVVLNFNGTFYAFGLWLDVRQAYREWKYFIVKKRKYRRDIAAL